MLLISTNRRKDKRTGFARKQNDVHMVPVTNYLFTMFYKPSFNIMQGSDTSSQYGDHFCEIVVKSNVK